MREIAPTIYFNVPKGFEALLPYLQADAELRRRFFSRLNMLFYAGAGLSRPTWDGYRELALLELGRPIPFTTSLGSTETGPGAIINVRGLTRTQNVGVPHRGVELKLVPNADKLEARLKGRSFLFGERITETDIRAFVTLVRFDVAYVGAFKCNLRRIADYPALSGYLMRILAISGVRETVNIDHIKRGYYSIKAINPNGIVPVGPEIPGLTDISSAARA